MKNPHPQKRRVRHPARAPASEGGRYKRKKNPKSGTGKPGPYTGKSTGRNACVAIDISGNVEAPDHD